MPHPLSHLDDAALCALAKQGDNEAAGVLVTRHERFIWKTAVPIAAKSNGRVDVQDLVQEGRIHLWRCIAKYDPSHNAKFLTWAGTYLWTRMRAVANKSGVITMPSNYSEGTAPLPTLCSIDADAIDPSTFNTTGSFADTILEPNHNPTAADEAIDGNSQLQQITNAIKALSPLLRHVIECRLAGDTLKSIGDPLNYSRQRIKQLELQALNDIRVFLGLEKKTRYGDQSVNECRRA